MWHPHVTVAAVIEHNGKFLLVRDNTSSGIKLNQPAGHLEPNETLIDAVIRETKEETGMDFIPQNIIGVYLMPASETVTYLRFCFGGKLKDYQRNPQPLDNDIVDAKWYSLDDINSRVDEHRAIVVSKCIEDFINGVNFPLSILTSFDNQSNLIK